MSMISAIIAESNNKIKKEWVNKLNIAFDKKDWNLIEIAIKEIKDYYFDE